MVACMPTTSLISGGSCAPMENSPPGIQTMPSGAGPGGRVALSTVGTNTDEACEAPRAGITDGLASPSLYQKAASAAVANANALHVHLLRDCRFPTFTI